MVLHLIEQRPSYGYELLSELEQKSSRFFSLREGTLYPVLYRLEDDGLIRSQRAAAGRDRGGPKKIYTVTPAGAERLAQMRRVWRQFSKSVDDILSKGDLTK